MFKSGIIKLENSGVELIFEGALQEEEEEVGITDRYFEIRELELLKGNLLDYTDWCTSKGKDALAEIERLILEQIN